MRLLLRGPGEHDQSDWDDGNSDLQKEHPALRQGLVRACFSGVSLCHVDIGPIEIFSTDGDADCDANPGTEEGEACKAVLPLVGEKPERGAGSVEDGDGDKEEEKNSVYAEEEKVVRISLYIRLMRISK